VRRLDPSSTVLADAYDAIVAEFMELDYDAVSDAEMARTLAMAGVETLLPPDALKRVAAA